MNISQLREILNAAAPYTKEQHETSIFDAAGRGYYENPSTDLLAFFLDPTQPHELSDCFISGILQCIPNTHRLSPRTSQSPIREAFTESGNRIDLLIKGDEWTLVIEHKIHHGVHNPFADYENHVRSRPCEFNQKAFFVLLSPSGVCPAANWVGLQHEKLIESIRRELGRTMLEQEPNKWHIFAREFLLHLENTVLEQSMDDETFQFVIDNMHKFSGVMELKENAIDTIDSNISERLSEAFPESTLKRRRHNWKQGPALRYALHTWATDSDLVVYLKSMDSGLAIQVRVYVTDSNEQLEELIEMYFKDIRDPERVWHEMKGTCFCMRWDLGPFDEEQVANFATQCMKSLSTLEGEARKKE